MKSLLNRLNRIGLVLLIGGFEVAALPQAKGAQGSLTCNQMYFGGIGKRGESNIWTFTANAGDSVIVRTGSLELVGTNSLDALVNLYGPSGTRLAQAGYDGNKVVEVTTRASSSGTFMVTVTAAGNPGGYRINLASTGCTPLASADGGGPMTNGFMHTGSLQVGELDAWSFQANAGDAMLVRVGNTTTNAPLLPSLRLYGPGGALLSSVFGYGYQAEDVILRATNSGTFMVLVAGGGAFAGRPDGAGSYRLKLCKTGDPIAIAPGDQGGPMTNGFMHLGTIDLGDADIWNFRARAGDGIFIAMGNLSTNGILQPSLRLYGPDGTLVSYVSGQYGFQAEDIDVRAATNGIYTVVLTGGNFNAGGVGDYRMTLAKTGDPIITAPWDEGGAMTNGWMYYGTNDLGDADVWTINAKAGETMVVRMGNLSTNNVLDPYLRIYGPAGNRIQFVGDYGYLGEEVTARATNDGSFMVVLTGGNHPVGGVGPYRISLAKTGSPIVVAPNDEGGAMVSGQTNFGTIPLGDLDVWSFYGHSGLQLKLEMIKTADRDGFIPAERVYGPDGTLLGLATGLTDAVLTLNLSSNGVYTVVVGDAGGNLGGFWHTGSYQLRYQLTGWPFDHVVLLTMENRSFDHLLGWWPGAGQQAGFVYTNYAGQSFSTFPFGPTNYSAGGGDNPLHTWGAGLTQFHLGLCDGWMQLEDAQQDTTSIGYYARQDLAFLGGVATNFTACARYFAPVMAETQPNRIYQYAAQTDSLMNRGPDQFSVFGKLKSPVTLDTIFDRMTNAFYYHDGFYTTLGYWGSKYDDISFSSSSFFDACTSGNLPALAVIDPQLSLGSILGYGNDDHPPADIRCGEAFMAKVYDAIASSPAWSNTVFIINFDEWGGFFDHVKPSQAEVPPGPEQAAYAALPITVKPGTYAYGLRGFRVPCLVISRWSRGGRTSLELFDHTSVLKMIEERWGLQPLTIRDQTANNLADVLDFKNPDPTLPPKANVSRGLCAFGTGLLQDTLDSFVIWNSGNQTLQSAPSVDGPWTTLPNANPPLQIPKGSGQKFFRTIVNP